MAQTSCGRGLQSIITEDTECLLMSVGPRLNTVIDSKLSLMTLSDYSVLSEYCNVLMHYLRHCRGQSLVGVNGDPPLSGHWVQVNHLPVKNSSGETGQRSALIVLHSIGLGETDWPSSVQMRAEIGRGRKPPDVSNRRSISYIMEQAHLFHGGFIFRFLNRWNQKKYNF